MLHARGCPLPLPSQLCGVGGLAGSIVSALFSAVAGWFAATARWLLSMLGAALQSSTAPPVTAAWFLQRQRVVLVVAAPIALLALLAAGLHAVMGGTAGELWRTVLVRLPVAFLLGGAAAGVVGVALAATDDVCTMLSSSNGASLDEVFRALSAAVGLTGTLPGAIGIVVSAVVLLGALVLWVELVIRAAAITVATALLPLVLAASLWPPAVPWARRLAETLGVLIASKAVIVLVLSIALGALAASSSGAATALTGGALLLLAAFSPYVLLRLVPAFEGAAASHLEHVRSRAASVLEHRGRQGVTMALGALEPAVLPSLDLVGSDPVDWMPGVDDDLVAGTALDQTASFVRGRPPIDAVPASKGTHVWDRDDYGPRLVWVPPEHGAR